VKLPNPLKLKHVPDVTDGKPLSGDARTIRGEYRLETDDSMFSDLRKELTNMLTSDSMRIAVLGAGGGLGRNVVDAARAAKHDVVALVRDPKRAELPDDVTTVVGDGRPPIS